MLDELNVSQADSSIVDMLPIVYVIAPFALLIGWIFNRREYRQKHRVSVHREMSIRQWNKNEKRLEKMNRV
jgi:uncharacterized membrane protein YozB (DUF420 family)